LGIGPGPTNFSRIVEAATALAGEKLSLRQISAALQAHGFVSEKGTPFSAPRVASMPRAKQIIQT